MDEIGIDISNHYSKSVETIPTDKVGTVITLCQEEVCPVFPADVVRHHWPLKDPAGGGGSDDQVLAGFRQARDQLQDRLRQFFAKS